MTDLNGFTYHSANANNNYEFYKSDGYYAKKVDGVDYMIQVVYNEEFKVTYIGIANDIPAHFNDEWPFYHDVDLLVESDSAVYLEFYLEKAYQEKPFLEHAILDITWNMGGNIGALYRVLGIMFGTPFPVSSFDPTLGEKSTNVISVDSYYSNLDWYILTSPVSFSAGNMLPSIVRQNNLAPILGQKSGGGAASVTPVYLLIGTIFAASSSNVSAVVSGENTTSSPYVYKINEGGIIPDHIIPLHQIFDEDVLKTIIYG